MDLSRHARRNHRYPVVLDPERSPLLEEGIEQFNAGHHWHAHEAWEQLWLGLEGDDKLFVQGLIMSAAMLHQYARKVERGVANHYRNVLVRLPAHAPRKWGIDVQGLLDQLRPFATLGDLDAATVRIERRQ